MHEAISHISQFQRVTIRPVILISSNWVIYSKDTDRLESFSVFKLCLFLPRFIIFYKTFC